MIFIKLRYYHEVTDPDFELNARYIISLRRVSRNGGAEHPTLISLRTGDIILVEESVETIKSRIHQEQERLHQALVLGI